MTADRDAIERYKVILRGRLKQDRRRMVAICQGDEGRADAAMAAALREIAEEILEAD